MFEKATKQKLRFDSPKGLMTVEDVWDLPLQHRSHFDLDTLAKSINRQLKEQEEESFVSKPTKVSEALKLKLDIVKHVIGVKVAEAEEKAKAVENKQLEQEIMAAIERKKAEGLEEKSIEELQEMLKQVKK